MEKEWVRQKMMSNTKEIYLAVCLNDDSRRMVGYTSVNDIDYVNRSARGGLSLIHILLCSCYYFMNEEKYSEFAWRIMHEWGEEKFSINVEKGWKINRAVDFYHCLLYTSLVVLTD